MFYIFDVDMTVAESDCEMTDEMKAFFLEFGQKSHKYFFCSGSAIPKMRHQISDAVAEQATALFPNMGGELWVDGERLYQRTFEWPEGLREDLERLLEESEYEERTGDHIQDRTTMVCFSIVGKAADMPARKRYTAWSNEIGDRVKICEELGAKYPTLHFSMGGQTSIDISDLGNDKSQVLPVLRERFGNEPVMFFGDRMQEGGNDYPLAEALKVESGVENVMVPVENPEDTLQKLKEILKA